MDSELQRLRRSDARYRAVLHASAAIVWIASPEGEFVERQPIWEEYTGQPWEEYRGSRWISIIHPEDREQVMADWTGAVQSGADVYRTQGRIWSARHGSWRAFQTRGVPVRDHEGRIIEWVGALTDVQDVVDAQERLLQREQELAESRTAAKLLQGQLRRLLGSRIVGIVSTHEDLIVAANEAFLSMIGRSGHDVTHHPISWRSLTPPGYETTDERALVQLRTLGECRPFEQEYIRSDGSRVPVLVSATTVAVEPLECICIVLDITAQKQAETALERARATAQRASDEKTFFLAAASHDLRQPLQVLATVLPMLAAQQGASTSARLLGRAQRAMQSLSELLNALLDFSQLDAGLIRPVVQDFPIERLLGTLREEWEIAAGEKGLRFSVHACHGWIKSDPALLGRIVRNFVSNAFKYTPPGGSVEIVCHERGETFVIEVTDTGIGIPEDKHKVIFEDFRQLGNAEREPSKGHGLGLSIVSRTACLLGHPLSMRSAAGAGSTFSVAVPIAEPRRDADPKDAKPAILPANLHILLVEDNDLVAEMTAEMLREAGSKVTIANSAEAAAEMVEAAQRPFDAVVSDFRLPRGSGVEAVAAVRRRWPQAQAVILTGDTNQPELRALPSQGIKLLLKPASESALAEVLAK